LVETVSFRNVGIIEVASTGKSFKLEILGYVYYINRSKLADVDHGRRSYTEVYTLEKPDEYADITPEPQEPKSLEIANQIRNRVLQINAET
jgi:hypothetical protein